MNTACQGNFSACHRLANPGLDEKDILTGTATAEHRRTLHYREFGSPKLAGFKFAVGRSAIISLP